jgi:hypothetical protein
MPDYPQYVRDLAKAWAKGDEHAGQVLRFLTSTPEERREAIFRAYRVKRPNDDRPDR